MIRSMTGYGRGQAEMAGMAFQVEIKAVNHRYGDISVKSPRLLMGLEGEIKKRVSAALRRGKIDVFIGQETREAATVAPVLNRPLADAYMQLFRQVQQTYQLPGDIPLGLLASQRDVFLLQEQGLDEAQVKVCVEQAIDQALEGLLEMRRSEGAALAEDIVGRLDALDAMVDAVEQRAPAVVTEWRQKLADRVARLQNGVEVDPQRLAQELAFFADRCDISEEITRFRSHVKQFREMMISSEPVGRNLDFLSQELNREANTMGSKSNDAELTRTVVTIKAELEKVREQVQNVE